MPIAQAGGLGEVAANLPRALVARGHDVRVVIPWYGAVDVARFEIRRERRVRFVYEGEPVWAKVGRTDVLGLPVYLVGHHTHTREMYRGKYDYYGWVEEHLRFRFFAAATAAAFADAAWQPDLLHINDYHTALIPTFWGPTRPPVVMSIHNAHYQGSFGCWFEVPKRLRDRDATPLPPLSSPRARFVNFLRRGIREADLVVPVSPNYARELAVPDQEDGIAGILPAGRVVGIANGIDARELDPSRDRNLARRYDASTLERRVFNKRALQTLAGFDVSDETPLLAMVARIDPQKGIDLLLYLIERLADRGVQVAFTGNGGGAMRDVIVEMADAAPGVLSYRPFVREEESLYHGGADIVLVPSRYEPCGLVQLKALRYGAVPIVQRVGGLADTVVDHVPGERAGTGFVFDGDTPEALLGAIDRALAVYRQPSRWRALQRRGMAIDVSWDAAAARYAAVYRRALADARYRVTGRGAMPEDGEGAWPITRRSLAR